MEIKFLLRDSPSKSCWRGKTVQITVRKPAKATFAGKNARGQLEIPRQNHFGGEIHHESEPHKRRFCNQTKTKRNVPFRDIPLRFG
ncbi:hypothetical protein C8U37_102177 [Trichococcus patagoniensis]|uniref:Uncharacterized protein n=1 Tax=Trichococcus patagoniensis TaxID=382641 RepID=A0A2T5IQH5_9LACT|nr:hypothetical protein C8U37_102177 [Trichococcus patagoniensis]